MKPFIYPHSVGVHCPILYLVLQSCATGSRAHALPAVLPKRTVCPWFAMDNIDGPVVRYSVPPRVLWVLDFHGVVGFVCGISPGKCFHHWNDCAFYLDDRGGI